MGTIPTPVFQGQSQFASDFQQVLTRAVNIASLPMQQMQNDLTTFANQQNALGGLSANFAALQTALQGIGPAATSVTTTSSDSTAVSASATASALPGTYSVQVTTLGSYTTAISSAGTPPVTDPTSGNISSGTSFTLTINGAAHTITPTGTSLNSLASAINGAGLGAQATVVNVGSTSSPDYRLSVTSTNLAPDTIQLNDGSKNLLTTLSTGAATSYTVNGVSTTSSSPEVTLAPGLTVSLLQQTASPVTITVAPNTGALSMALSGFATAYNAAVDALGQQHGQNAGALAGQSTILTLGQALSSINQYASPGSNPLSLASVGLNLDKTGHFSFDPTALNNLSPSTVQQFFGSLTSGGFLQAANTTLTAITDPNTGIIQSSLATLQTDITNENSLIAEQQDQITQMENALQQRLSEADAALATLEAQNSFFTSVLSTTNANNFVGH
jgi:flagellar hook-associated protein 2